MPDTAMYWLGTAVATVCSIALVAAAAVLALWALFYASNRLLTEGLRTIRIANWRYWNDRMLREGLISMPRFYSALVAERQPKTVPEWQSVDREAELKELEEEDLLTVPMKQAEAWLEALEAYWDLIDYARGPSKGGLEGAIERGEEPEIAEMRAAINASKRER